VIIVFSTLHVTLEEGKKAEEGECIASRKKLISCFKSSVTGKDAFWLL